MASTRESVGADLWISALDFGIEQTYYRSRETMSALRRDQAPLGVSTTPRPARWPAKHLQELPENPGSGALRPSTRHADAIAVMGTSEDSVAPESQGRTTMYGLWADLRAASHAVGSSARKSEARQHQHQPTWPFAPADLGRDSKV